MVVVIFVFFFLWIGRAYLAGVIANKPNIKNYQAAMRLDPGNADYPLNVGRAFEYSVQDADPDLAVKNLMRSIQRNSYLPQAWLDLASAYEFQGDSAKAEQCMRRADELAPRIPAIQWAIGNFFLLHDNVAESFKHFRMVLDGFTGYENEIYRIAWKASGNGPFILSHLIPNSAGASLYYLGFLVSTHRLDDAAQVWSRVAASPEAFPPTDAAYYLDALISARDSSQAWKVWSTLREKGLIPSTDLQTPQNLVENGNFENPLLGFGFGWRVGAVAGVYVDLDDSAYHSPSKSLLIQFPGTQNLEYHNVFQFVPVLPGHRYRLSGFMKTGGITSDSGVRFEVKDAYNPARLDKYSDALTGSTRTWTPLTIDFTTGSETSLLVVDIARPASQEFGNQIGGKVWVDDVTLAAPADAQ